MNHQTLRHVCDRIKKRECPFMMSPISDTLSPREPAFAGIFYMCNSAENSESWKLACSFKQSGLLNEVDTAFDRKARQSEGSYCKQATEKSRAIYSSSCTVHFSGGWLPNQRDYMRAANNCCFRPDSYHSRLLLNCHYTAIQLAWTVRRHYYSKRSELHRHTAKSDWISKQRIMKDILNTGELIRSWSLVYRNNY
jgi:hypothetical protein